MLLDGVALKDLAACGREGTCEFDESHVKH